MDLKKQEGPFRLVYLVITIIVVFACLVGLYFQDPVRVLIWLTGIGLFLGIVLLLLGLVMIPALVNERKNKTCQVYSQERLKQHQARFRQHQARFYCHICGKPSPRPNIYWDQEGEGGHLFSEFPVTDWDNPTELGQCFRCHKWTCFNADPPHMKNGICKYCLENLSAGNRVSNSPAEHSVQRTAGIPHISQAVSTPQRFPDRMSLHHRFLEGDTNRWASVHPPQKDAVNSSRDKKDRYDIYNRLLYPEQEIGRYMGKVIMVVSKPTSDEYNVLLTLLTHKKARMRWMAACRLGKIGDEQAVKSIIQALTDEHWMVRLHAAKALGCIDPSVCLDPLVATIHDNCNYVRRATMRALRKANFDKDPRVIEALLSLLQGSDEYSQVDVIKYLKYTPSPTVIDTLTDAAFRDHDNNVSREVLNAFARMGSLAIIRVGKLLEHPNKEVRYHAAIILGYRGDKRAIQYLESTLNGADPKLRERTKFFLAEFRKRYPEL